jgi:hypothetical protein
MKRLIVLAMAVAALVVCGSSAAATTAPKAKQVIQELAAHGLPVHLTVVYTAATDPNHLLGRPNGYLSKASFSDRRVSSSDTEGDTKGDVNFGGSVEVFSSASGAKRRAAYIESMEKALPILGTEYDYLNGPVLVRVSQYLTPTQAKGYQRALAKLKV